MIGAIVGDIGPRLQVNARCTIALSLNLRDNSNVELINGSKRNDRKPRIGFRRNANQRRSSVEL
jgi:hypothetical protein